MSKYLIPRSKRIAFVKSTLRKCKSQLKLLERNRVQPYEEKLVARQEEYENQEEDLEHNYMVLTGQKIFYWRKSHVDETKVELLDEFTKDEHKEEDADEIFYDFEDEISVSKMFDSDTEEGQVGHADSMTAIHPQNFPSKSLLDRIEIINTETYIDNEMCFDNEDIWSDDDVDGKYTTLKSEAVLDRVTNKWRSFAKQVVLWLLFVVIGLYILQFLDMWDEGDVVLGAGSIYKET